MTTFSQLVDEILAETKRPDLLAEAVSYLNQTIREVHFEPSRGNVVFYSSNRDEVQLVADTDSGYVWEIPDPQTFQGIEAVRFPGNYLNRLEYVSEATPGPMLASKPFFWYRAGGSIVFGGSVGYGGIGSFIQLSFFRYPRGLKYKIPAVREASYDVDDGWTYHVDYDVDEVTRATARERVTNWLLMRWADVLREGLRAKIYKRLSDETRQRTSYSMYAQLRQGLFTSEAAELTGVG